MTLWYMVFLVVTQTATGPQVKQHRVGHPVTRYECARFMIRCVDTFPDMVEAAAGRGIKLAGCDCQPVEVEVAK